MLTFTPMRTRLLAPVILVLLFAACSPQETTDSAAFPEETEPILCPLTGVEASANFPVDRPALAVKIDNAPPARPQVGLQAADIVYEELGEGGLTRFLAIYHCDDAEEVGPVRSARNVDVDIVAEYDPALFAHSGANNQVLAKIAGSDWIVDLRHGDHADAFRRAADRNAPVNLMSSTEVLREIDKARDVEGPPATGMSFNAALLGDEPAGAEGDDQQAAGPGTGVTLSFANRTFVGYTYDPDRGTYLRSQGSSADALSPHTLVGGAQVSAVNVVVQKSRIVAGTVLDASGSPTQDTTVVGSGEVVVLRAGEAVTGTWSRPTMQSNTTFTADSGEVIELVPGNTFIHLVPEAREITLR